MPLRRCVYLVGRSIENIFDAMGELPDLSRRALADLIEIITTDSQRRRLACVLHVRNTSPQIGTQVIRPAHSSLELTAYFSARAQESYAADMD